MSTTIDLASPDKKNIRNYFDQIAGNYDFINTFLSFNLDENWRRQSLKHLYRGQEKTILDIGVGTGKFLKLFLQKKKWDFAAGLDFSEEMLLRARQNIPSAQLTSADFHSLPFKNNFFDLVISSFTLRSVKDVPLFLSETFRVLRPGGCAGFLCLTRPQSFPAKLLYYPYLKFYLPFVGRFISGHREAYQFLSQSIQKFQDPSRTLQMMEQAGFQSVRKHTFLFEAATLLIGEK